MTVQERIDKARAEKAHLMAQFCLMFDIPSSALDPQSEHEWIELRHAAATYTGRQHTVPSHTSRLMILAMLRKMEFRKGTEAK